MNISEVQLLLAAPQASGGYTTPGSVYNSLGRWASTTQMNLSVPMNNLFPDLTGAQNAALQVDYQCLFVYNSDTTDTLTNAWAWLPSGGILGTVQWAVGADSTPASAYNTAGTAQAGYIANPTTAPSTVTSWFGPSSAANGGAALPSIGPGMLAALWIRRTAVNSAAFAGAGFNLQITFDVVS